MRRNSSSKLFNFSERQWDSSEQAAYIEPFKDVRCAVKRLFSGTLQLPRLSCRPSMQDQPQEDPASGPIVFSVKPSRGLGTLTSLITKAL
ncbi:cAMP-specific 3'%2C5'-cyclic phosphodiesterase 4D isoform X1 [Scomber scombrus]|uniref:cAMP-specific 3',5'-cyclic phosphodiesterase 4D isoform X1 n=1 Tax=Scomber scombrus TaxID=13677 RepID=A0AAV1N199_SCOSC